jgi:F-type H+-transporting ATPase subunit b
MSVLRMGVVGLAAVVALAPQLALASDGEGSSAEIFWQLVNFLLLLGVLFAVARKPMLGFFADRREGIQDDIKTAAELLSQAESRHGEWQRKLVDLEQEMESIRETARVRAREESDHILSDAQAMAERIQRDARAAVERELRRARQELAREASELSMELAAQLLREQVTEGDRDRLMDEFISGVERQSSGQVPDVRER